ncbi:autophagy protein atg9, partial [Coelomomyces lativittatus]
MNASYSPTFTYISQFPSEYMTIWIKFFNFIFGALAGLLVFISIMYPDTLIYLELGFHRTPVFYLSVFTSLLAMLRSLRPNEHTLFDPHALMDQIVHWTHFKPTSPWYSLESKKQLLHAFPLRLTLYFREFLSFFIAPYMLCFKLPSCAENILVYFADHLVYKEPLGYILDVATFDTVDTSDDKLVQSMVYFKSTHPTWQPPLPLDPTSFPLTSSPKIHSGNGPSLVNMLQQ